MKRLGNGSGARMSLIVALVFPAMIAAALALAYYGYEYAASLSRPITRMFQDMSRDEAEKVGSDVDTRVDAPALALFEKIQAMKKDPPLDGQLPCDIDPGPEISSFALFDGAKRLVCTRPASSKRIDDFWRAHSDNLKWKAVKLGSWHHHHDPARDVVLVYTARKIDEDERFYVAARLSSPAVLQVVDEALAKVRKNLRVTVVDLDGRLVAGARAPEITSARAEPRLYEARLGKALYDWQVQIVPQNDEAFQAEAERQKRLKPLMIILSTAIIAVGLGIVWLVVATERRASRLKSDFIANVSHELKTPLSLIRMFGEMVATGRHKGEGAAREYGAIITRESERLSHLIDNVLDFARLERGKASYDFAEGNLGEVVERALDICRYRLDKERLKLRTELEHDLPPVRMDENAITLVILNLVDNAIKYGADGGEVEVTLRRAPGGVVLSVRDFGHGVGRDEQGRIFERFYRASAARDRNVRGSGIGLALVKHIAEAHGGRVTVESPPSDGRPGAMFRLHLPAPILQGSESAGHHIAAAGSER